MEASLESRLFRAAALTFEELAFMFTDPELNPRQLAAPFAAAGAIDFRGPFRGRIVVRLFGDLLPTLTANMLGETQGDDPALQEDSLKEIANVICGNLLPLVAGDTAVFNLEPPCFHAHPVGPPAGLRHKGSVSLGLEAGRAEVELFTDQPDGEEC
ncbi:MAG: hypothetical protein Kow001_01710 [Acidobacteriota bacterium]